MLIFKLSCEKETIPAKLISDAALVSKILQEKLAVETNSQHINITAIFAADTSNPRLWSVIFDSSTTKQNYETRMSCLQRILMGLRTCIGYEQRILLSSSL